MIDAVVMLAPTPGLTASACAALNLSRASVYRQRWRLAGLSAVRRPRPKPFRALAAVERQIVLDLLHAPRFADQAPAEIYACLLDEGVYHCSIRTMYRILATSQQVRERRKQLRHPVYKKPELLAQAPTAAIQMFAGLSREIDGDAKPFQLDRCHALESSTDTVRRYYPRWYRGAA